MTREQRDELARLAVRYRPEGPLWAEYRRRWQADLIRLLDARADAPRFEAGFRQLIANREAYYGPELTAIWQNNRALMVDATVRVANQLTDRQRTHVDRRIAGLARDLRQLAGSASESCAVVSC